MGSMEIDVEGDNMDCGTEWEVEWINMDWEAEGDMAIDE